MTIHWIKSVCGWRRQVHIGLLTAAVVTLMAGLLYAEEQDFHSPIELVEGVKDYLDQVEAQIKNARDERYIPTRSRLLRHHPRDEVTAEIVRQAWDGRSEALRAWVLRGFRHTDHPAVREVAIGELASEHSELRQRAAMWCLHRLRPLPDEIVPQLRTVVREEFERSQGRRMLFAFGRVAQPEDQAMLRRLYRQVYQDQTHPLGMPLDDRQVVERSRYSCTWAFHPVSTSRTEILALRYQVGDREAIGDVRQALTQQEDVQRRAWAIHLAMHLQDPGLLSLLQQTLTDKRRCAEPVWVKYAAADEAPLHTFYHLRLCDLAVRAIHLTIPPDADEPWPMHVPFGAAWVLRDMDLNEMQVIEVGDRLFRQGLFGIVEPVIVGYDDEQLDHVGRYVDDWLIRRR